MTIRSYEGSFDARDLRVGIVASRFNETISKRLVDGALDCLRRHGAHDERVSVTWVPGAFELPGAAGRLAKSREVDAIVCVGCVIRGETAHFEYVAGSAGTGIARLQAEADIPVTFGVLTTETTEQAEARAGGKMGNQGFSAALAAIEMANLYAALPKPEASL
jgi:6,7-dimethyl-8-ribityllumazine synthase